MVRRFFCRLLASFALPTLAQAAPPQAQPLLAVSLTLVASLFGGLLLLALWSGWRQRRTLRELRQREALIGGFFDNSPLGLAILDREMRYTRSNAVRARLDGRAAGGLVGTLLNDVSSPLAEAATAHWHDMLVGGRTATNLEIDGCGPTHDRRWRVSWFPITSSSTAAPFRVGEVVTDVTESHDAQRSLVESAAQIQRLMAHREAEREREYHRLAREFHDELGQTLTGARLQLSLIEPHLATNRQLLQSADTLGQMLVEASRSIKTIAADLRPPALNLGLAAAIEWQAGRALTPAGVRTTLALAPIDARLDEATSIALFRIAQEAMTNIVRYAEATTAHLSLRIDGDAVVLAIADDGKGFDPDVVDRMGHFGLTGMAERAQAVGARLDIDSVPGEGTRITVSVPCGGKP